MMRPRQIRFSHMLLACAWMLAYACQQSGAQGPTNNAAGSHGVNGSSSNRQGTLAGSLVGDSRANDDAWKGERNVVPNGTQTTGSGPSAITNNAKVATNQQPTIVRGNNGAGQPTPANSITNLNQRSVQPASGTVANNQSAQQVTPASFDSQRFRNKTVLPPKSHIEPEAKTKSSGGTAQVLVSIFSSLAVVIGLFLGLALLYRKSISASLGKSLPKNVVQVLGKTSVAARQQLVLIRFGSKLVLVSMIQGEARAISEICDPLEVDQLAGFCESSQSGSTAQSFREMLVQGVKR